MASKIYQPITEYTPQDGTFFWIRSNIDGDSKKRTLAHFAETEMGFHLCDPSGFLIFNPRFHEWRPL